MFSAAFHHPNRKVSFRFFVCVVCVGMGLLCSKQEGSSGAKAAGKIKSIESFPVVYVGTLSLPITAYAGVDACYHAVTAFDQLRKRQQGEEDDEDDERSKGGTHSFSEATSTDPDDLEDDFREENDGLDATEGLRDVKTTLAVSIYGVKAMVPYAFPVRSCCACAATCACVRD